MLNEKLKVFFSTFIFISVNIVNMSMSKADWHCLCYKEIYKGNAKLSTACRKTSAQCEKLEIKVSTGSAVIVPGSLKISCKAVPGDYPWHSMGDVDQWIASKKKNSYWTPSGCLLDNTRTSFMGDERSTILEAVTKIAG